MQLPDGVGSGIGFGRDLPTGCHNRPSHRIYHGVVAALLLRHGKAVAIPVGPHQTDHQKTHITMSRQIIALGTDDACSSLPWHGLYLLAQSPKPNPRICLLATPSADDRGVIRHFMQTFDRYPCRPTYLEVFQPTVRDMAGFIQEQDILYVSGGQSKSSMALWHGWNLIEPIRQAYQNGTILSGGSAGAVCWFEQCVTDSFPGALTSMPALGFLPGSFSPHFSSPSRRAVFSRLLAGGQIGPGYAADDGAGVHFVDEQFHRAISLVPHATAHQMSLAGDRARRDIIDTTWLGLPENQQLLLWQSPAFCDV